MSEAVLRGRSAGGLIAGLMALLLVITATGCAGNQPRLDAAPDNVYATPVGFRGIRYWGDSELKKLDQAIAERRDQLAQAAKTDPTINLKHADYLAISGGGSNGAYGAGLLVGWTAKGNRPRFEVVTGISTGSLSAPFAFLGPAYDAQLTKIYTDIDTKDVLTKKGPLQGLFGESMADNAPLKKLVAHYVTPQLLDAIAAERAKGRRLFVGTTNIDAQRPVVWDMTAIAASENPEKLALFRNVLVASAAIPGVFPPEMIKVTAEGRLFEEMHVDGGTATQVFLMPTGNSLRDVDKALGHARTRSVYIIRNGTFAPKYKKTDASTLAIAARSIDTLILNQGIGDIYRMYAQSERDHTDFNVASIPPDFNAPNKSAFDPVYMRALYKEGYKEILAGKAWQKVPPGYRE
ncbi:MAG: patatin-like phospholipase family protein [Hyphomicrobiales bacterium]